MTCFTVITSWYIEQTAKKRLVPVGMAVISLVGNIDYPKLGNLITNLTTP